MPLHQIYFVKIYFSVYNQKKRNNSRPNKTSLFPKQSTTDTFEVYDQCWSRHNYVKECSGYCEPMASIHQPKPR